MIHKDFKSNDALLAVLLGGNPGFPSESTFTSQSSTPGSISRLSLLPTGVSMLLKRWTKLQHVERAGTGRSAADILHDLSLSALSSRPHMRSSMFSADTSQHSRDYHSTGGSVNRSHSVNTQSLANGSIRTEYSNQIEDAVPTHTKRGDDGDFDSDAVVWSVRASNADSENLTFDIDKSWCEEGSSGILDMGSEDPEIPTTGPGSMSGLGLGPGLGKVEGESAYRDGHWTLTDRVTDLSRKPLSTTPPRCKLLLTDFLPDTTETTEEPRQPYYRGYVAHAPYLPGVLSTDYSDHVSVSASAASTKAWPIPFGWDPSFTPQVAVPQSTKWRKGKGKWHSTSIPTETVHVGGKDDSVFLDSQGSSVDISEHKHNGDGVKVSRSSSYRSPYDSNVRRQGGASVRLSKGEALKGREKGSSRTVHIARKGTMGKYQTARSISHAAKEKVKHADPRSSGIFLVRAIHTHSGSSPVKLRTQNNEVEVKGENERLKALTRQSNPSQKGSSKQPRKGNGKMIRRRKDSKAVPATNVVYPSGMFAVQQVALDQIMGHFSESVMEISESLGTVSAQLRGVTATISESMSILEQSRSRGNSPNISLAPGSAFKTDPRRYLNTPRDDSPRIHEVQSDEKSDALYHDMLFNEDRVSGSGSRSAASSSSRNIPSDCESTDSKRRTNMREEGDVEDVTASQEREYSPCPQALPPLLVESYTSPLKTPSLARSDDEAAWARMGLGLGSGVKSPSGRIQFPAGPYMVTSPGIFIMENGTGFSSPELRVFEEDQEMSHSDLATMIKDSLAMKLRAVLRPSLP